jgi:Siphovirus Gp157
MTSLFGISDDLIALSQLLDDMEGEGQEDLIMKWLEELEEDRDSKIDNYATLIKELQASAYARDVEAARIKDLSLADQKKADVLLSRLKYFLELHGIPKLNTTRFSISVAKNGGKTPVSVFVDIDSVPSAYVKIREVKTVDKDLIREELEAGHSLPFARLAERGTNLRIK